MRNRMLMAGAVVAALMTSVAAYAQSGATTGAVGGAVGGAIVGGPVGAVVGGVGGAIVGGIADERRPAFREYVVRERRPSYTYKEEVRIGAQLPSSGVTYYEVPSDVVVRIGVPPSGYKYVRVASDILMIAVGTRMVVDAIEDLRR